MKSSPSRPGQGPGPHQVPAEILPRPRVVIVEPHPAVQAVLEEHLLIREGYAVETHVEVSVVAPARKPGLTAVLFLVGVEDGESLYVFQMRDVAGALAALTEGVGLPGSVPLPVFGIHAYTSRPFGILVILRVVRAVSGFDGRKKGPPRAKS